MWLDITASKFYDWRERYGKVNEHNGWVPRDFWLEDWEKQAIIGFHLKNPLEGYRRLTFMMLDADIVAVSPTSVWRVLGQAGLLSKWNGKPSKKGTGFEQPLAAHQHWHIDVSYINISGTFYYLCSIPSTWHMDCDSSGGQPARSFTQSELIRKDLLGIHFCIPYLFTRNRNELQCKLGCFRWNRPFRRHSLLRVENGL